MCESCLNNSKENTDLYDRDDENRPYRTDNTPVEAKAESDLDSLREGLMYINTEFAHRYEEIFVEANTRIDQKANGEDKKPLHLWAKELDEFIASRREALFFSALTQLRNLLDSYTESVPEGWRP